MSEFDPTNDAAFREYAHHALRRHGLLCAGKEDSTEIVDAEDAMEKLWPKLDDAQRRSLKGMASDLNWLRRKGEPPPKGRKTPAEVPESDQQELTAAMRAKEWHRILHFLRLCAPVFRDASLACERGIAYEAIDLPEYATAFKEFFVELTGRSGGTASLSQADRLLNCDSAIDARAVASSRTNTVLVWEANGVKSTALPSVDVLFAEGVEYKACA